MLSPDDAALCARDPALPGLATLLDADALACRTGRSDMTVAYLRYKPGTSCLIGLVPTDRSLDALAVMAYPPARYAELRTRTEWRSGPEPVAFCDEICTALVPLRHVRHVKGAKALADQKRRAALLHRLGLRDVPPTLLRCKPERRLVLRVVTETGQPALLKCHNPNDFPAARLGALHAAAHADAPLLGMDERRHIILSAWIPGAPLSAATLSAGAFGKVGAAIARLHAIPAGPLVQLDRRSEAKSVASAADMLAVLLPHLAPKARRLAERITATLAALPFQPRTLHGDFSADQVILREGTPVLLDWDRIAQGDAGQDLGIFLARLDADILDGRLSPQKAEAAGAALLEGYAGMDIVPDTVHAQHARALMALTAEGFRHRLPDWAARSEALLARIEDLLGGSSPDMRVPRIPELEQALDAEVMRPELQEALGVDIAKAAVAIKLLRHKPGRRALVRYGFGPDMPHTVLGKIRAKGPDLRTPALHIALRASGLDGSAAHRVGVPRAFGRIDRLHMWLQEEVPGRGLADYLDADRGAVDGVFARTGAALAWLHDVPPATDRCWSLRDECEVLERALERASQDRPQIAGTLQAICQGARASLEDLAAGPTCGIHRDFYFDQVLVDGKRIWLVDLDLYTLGDPAIDLGNFLAHLDEMGLRRSADRAAFAAQADSFLSGYAGVRSLPDAHRIEVLRAISLARHIHIASRFSDRRHTIENLIAITLDRLAPGTRIVS